MKKIITLVVLFFLLQNGKANNVVINNVSLVNNGPDNIYVQFDLSWQNSWRVLSGPSNYDGVWVYFKYKTATGNWAHLTLNSIATADLLPAGLAYWRSPFGSVLHRSAGNLGNGNITATGVRLAVSNTVPYNIELRAFAVEMVFIPSPNIFINETFALGDGDGATESTNAFHKRSGPDNNYAFALFTSTTGIGTDVNVFDDAFLSTSGFFAGSSTGDGVGSLFTANFNYPVSSAIWCMKYEVTQGAYRDFLNTLTLTQQTTRTATTPTAAIGTGALTISGTNRNFLEIKTPSSTGLPAIYGCDASANNIYDEANDGEFVACNFLGWPDLAAWLDWAGLAPMTEMHFERICRGYTSAGPNLPVAGEFAWGSNSIITTALTLTTPFTATETISNGSTVLGNANYGNLSLGPLRNGVFATATSNRITSGASFFGVMDMSGNLTETCVTVGNAAGRSYNKGPLSSTSIGNGFLSINGNALANYWPGNVANATLETVDNAEVTTAAGTIRRGGDFSSPSTYLRVSDRSDGEASVARANYQGGRGVIVLAMY
jgi:formylglycine-generating enzyme required for sulfatase activity